MSVLVVGSTALDTIKTPAGAGERLLGGSASHASVAASFFAPVRLVGVVGDDFPEAYLRLYKRRRIDLAGLQIVPGKTFHWAGEYEINMNNRRTLVTELGVFAEFRPILPQHYRRTPFVLLGNISPSLQHHVLDQMQSPRFVAADTMDLWLNTALDELLRLLRRIDLLVLNDSEARQLTGENNVLLAAKAIHRLGPRYVIIKKGEHGSMLSGPMGVFVCPAYPLERVVDPTGAGDSFAGGLMGYLAASNGRVDRNIRHAMLVGSVVASFCCEGLGLERTAELTKREIARRMARLKRIAEI